MKRSTWYFIGTVVVAQALVWGLAVAAERMMPIAPASPSAVPATPEQAPRITVTEVRQQLAGTNKPLIIDLREDTEYRAGHIPGAILVPYTQLGLWAGKAPPAVRQRPIVLYCACPAEHSSATGVILMRNQGFREVTALLGSWQAWTATGGTVVTGPKP